MKPHGSFVAQRGHSLTIESLVRTVGLEPTRPCGHWLLRALDWVSRCGPGSPLADFRSRAVSQSCLEFQQHRCKTVSSFGRGIFKTARPPRDWIADGIIVPRTVKRVLLITDGSCLGNPGPGGWACVLRFAGVAKEFFGYDPHTTNNRMELMAPIQGLLVLKEPCEVDITTDSEYVRQGITKWIVHWKRRHWWKKKRPVRNADLWIELDELAGIHRTNWSWTKGHAGHDDNNRCDWLAQNAARKQISSWADGRAHGALRHDLGPDYVPPNPQAGLFDGLGVVEDDPSDPG